MDNRALAKRRRLSLALNKPSKRGKCSRFPSPTELDALTKAAEGVVPINTNKVW